MYENNHHLPDLEPKKRFRFFGGNRDDKDFTKEDVYQGHDLKGFFISLKLHFSQLISVNILMILGNFPLFFLLLGLSDTFRLSYMAPTADIYSAFGGLLLQSGGSAISNNLFSLFGVPTVASVLTIGNYISFALAGLTLFTFGLVNVGTTYLLREMVRGNPVFIWGDFWEAVKRNWKQGFFYGILDLILLLVIPLNLYILISDSGFFSSFLFFCTLFIALFYFFMRFYIYLQMVTFDLPITKILKNALIFTILNLKRNLLVLLGVILLVAIDFLCLFASVTIPFAIALPLVILFALGSFMAMYAGYFKVEEIMVAPDDDDEESPDNMASSDSL